MACTGELPPNSRSGQNFIHDPKVAGETEVKGQIKLRFVSAIGQEHTVTRNYQLTQKPNSLQFKSLSNYLGSRDPVTNEACRIDHRCAEIDSLVPQLLGVSRAILENVIFVHQEDSNWPLADVRTLKDKFDDIFAATKYTKASEELRKTRIKQEQEVKEMRLEINTLKSYRSQAMKLRETVKNGQARSKVLEDEIAALKMDIDNCDIELDRLKSTAQKFQDSTSKIATLKAQCDLLSSQNRVMYERLSSMYSNEDLSMPVDELRDLEDEVLKNFSRLSSSVEGLTVDFNNAQREADSLQAQVTKDTESLLKLQTEHKVYISKQKEYNSLLFKAFAKANLELPSGISWNASNNLSDGDAKLMETALWRHIDTARGEKIRIGQRHQTEMEGETNKVIEHSLEIKRIEERIRSKNEQRRELEDRIQNLERQLHSLKASAETNSLSSTIAQLEEALADKSTHMDSLRRKRREVVDKIKELSDHQTNHLSSNNDIDGATPGHVHGSLLPGSTNVSPSQHDLLCRLLTDQKDRLKASNFEINSDLVINIIKAFQRQSAIVRSKNAGYSSRLIQRKNTEEELERVESYLAKAELTYKDLGAQLGQARGFNCEDEDYFEALAKLEMELLKKVIKHERCQLLGTLIQGHQNHARQNQSCPTCHRALSDQEYSEFEKKSAQEEEQLNGEAKRAEDMVGDAQTRLRALKPLTTIAVRHEILDKEEIPQLRDQKEGLIRKIEQLKLDEARAKSEFDLALAREMDAKEAINQIVIPFINSSRRIGSLGEEGGRISQPTALTAQKLSELNKECGDIDKSLASLTSVIDSLRAELHTARSLELQEKQKSGNPDSIQQQIQEAKAVLDELSREIPSLERSILPLQQNLSDANERSSRNRLRRAKEIEDLDASINALEVVLEQMESLQRSTREFEERNGLELLLSAQESLESLKQNLKLAEERAQECAKTLAEKREAAAESESLKRLVSDILNYHASKAEESKLLHQMNAEEAELELVGRLDEIKDEECRLTLQRSHLQSKVDQAIGVLSKVKEEIQCANRELKAPQYNRIDQRFIEKAISLETTDIASRDLEKFHKAVERALLQFHTTKMAEINKIIKELWQKTYRNSDIDYVQIRADTEGRSAQRSYNYRVVMICGNAELDMRGRCSAGQKVLASLIIRLALAETFCLNCGILALDEPTTNLDSENAASLAESLKSIISAREGQKNFQLIVITHDEVFARNLGSHDFAKDYWHISKDTYQNSAVKRKEI